MDCLLASIQKSGYCRERWLSCGDNSTIVRKSLILSYYSKFIPFMKSRINPTL